MHRWIAPLALTLAFAACVHRVPVDEAAFYEPYEEPLEARILPFGGLSFVINRPAHVAIFEIVPGRGVSLLYPAYEHENALIRSGYHNPVGTLSRTTGRWFYSSVGWSTGWEGPRYLYLVASARPLRIDNLMHSPSAVRSFLGLTAFTSHNAFATMESLTWEVLPFQSDADWATDVYVQWPAAPRSSYLAQRVRIQCADGRILLVPISYGSTSCPGDSRVAMEQAGDRPDGEKPQRRRPRVLPIEGDDGRTGATRATGEASDVDPRSIERRRAKSRGTGATRAEPSAGAEGPRGGREGQRARPESRPEREPRRAPETRSTPDRTSAPAPRTTPERPAPQPSPAVSRPAPQPSSGAREAPREREPR